MSLRKETRVIKFLGLDGKTDVKTTLVGKMDVVENAFAIKRTDMVTGFEYRKRYGITNITRNIEPSGTLAAGTDISVFQDELTVCDGELLYTYSPALSKWVPKGFAQAISAYGAAVLGNRGAAVSGGTATKQNVDIAGVGNIVVQVCNNTGAGTFDYFVYDLTTGSTIASGNVTGTRVKLASVGSQVNLFVWNGANNLTSYKITTAAPTSLAGNTVIVTNVNASGIFDVISDPTNGRYIIVYHNTTPGTTQIIWNPNDTAGASQAIVSTIANVCVGFLHWDMSNGNAYVAAGTSSANGVRWYTVNATTMAVSGETNIDAAVTTCRNITGFWNGASGNAIVYYEIPNATVYNTRIGHYLSGTGTATMARSVGLASKTYKIGSKYYTNVCYESTTQRHLFVMQQVTPTSVANGAWGIVGFLMNGNGGGVSASASMVPNVAYVSATRVISTWYGADSPLAPKGFFIWQFDLNWSRDLLSAPVEFNGTLHLPGALQRIFDGLNTVETGFMISPETAAPAGGAGGALTSLGTYQWCCVYRWADKNGNVYRSFPGKIDSLTLAAGQNQAALTVPTLRITEKTAKYNYASSAPTVSNVLIDIYRTKDKEANFYRVTSLINDVTADTIAYTDATADTSIASNELLYITGGTVGNVMPPMANAIATWKNRLFTMSGDSAVWHTKETISGVGAEYGDTMRIVPDVRDGVFTAMCPMDAAMVLFKRSSVYVLTGSGPTPNGVGVYQPPMQLTSKEGAISFRAIAAMPDGVIFKSAKGWRIVSRAYDVLPLEGADAYDTLTVTGSTATDDRPYVVFTTSEGRVLVYDWHFRTWYTWTSIPSVGAVRWQNGLVYLKSDGTAQQEVTAQYNDNGSAITMTLKTAHIGLSELFGNVRLYRSFILGDYMSTTTLSMKQDYDYGVVTGATKSVSVTSSSKGPHVYLPTERRYPTTVQMTITESSTTEGVKVSALGVEIGFRKGARKFPVSRHMV